MPPPKTHARIMEVLCQATFRIFLASDDRIEKNKFGKEKNNNKETEFDIQFEKWIDLDYSV